MIEEESEKNFELFFLKLKKELKSSNFILKPIEEILWNFSDGEIMIKDDKLFACHKCNRKNFLKITVESNLVKLELYKNNKKLDLIINSEIVKFLHQKIEKINSNKIIALTETTYDYDGNFVSQNSWNNILYRTSEKKGCLKKLSNISKTNNDLYYKSNVMASNNFEGKNFRTEEKESRYKDIEIPNLREINIDLFKICNEGIHKLYNINNYLKTLNEEETSIVKKLNF